MTSNPSSPTGYLHTLCRQGNIAAIQSYLNGIEDNSKLEERVGFLGYTPLHEATNLGQTKVVRLLLLYGANANAKANGFYTPLHIAASMDNVDCVVELLNHNADITSKDEFGKTAYETAIIHKCKKSARILKSEEIKKAARENNPDLKDMLASISDETVLPTCLREALLEASRGGHMDAICALIITGGRHSLKLRDCISEAVKFHCYEAAALLLACYAAKHDKKLLLRYLMSEEMSRQEEEQVIKEHCQPNRGLPRDVLDKLRSFIVDKESFNIAVPIGLALQQRKNEAAGIILRNTNCNQRQKQVNWPKLVLEEIDPLWLESIKWVEKLFLASNLLASVPSNIHVLDKLCCLDLRRNQLKSIPSRLLQMPSLRDLRLSENKLTELPRNCKWSPSLKSVYLSDNSLETLPKSMATAKLTILYLARNNLYEVPQCIWKITTLQSLDLSGNPRLTQLPSQMGRLINIEMLRLENLEQMTDPPDAIKQNGVKTIMYLRNSLRSSKAYYTVKLMLVGRAEQGKTTLMHRLMRDYTYNINQSTNGIAMDEFRYNRREFGPFSNYPEFKFKIWDFGGQEDFYTTHQCFLSTLALYLLVWNLQEGDTGIEMLKSWLDTISATASNISLIIVGTHLDEVRKNREAGYEKRMHDLVKELTNKYAGQMNVVDIKEVSCALDNKEGIDDLRLTIYDAAAALKKTSLGQVSVMGEMIPHSFLLVESAIHDKRQELHELRKLPIMHKSEYEALVLDIIKNDPQDIEDTNDLREVTQFMHERGILLHYNDPNQDLQDLYFIDPKWLCELMARVVTLPEVNPYIHNGVLNLDDLPQILRGELFAQHNSPQFIRLLNRFQVACSLGDNRVLIPSKLPAKKPDQATNADLPFITLKRLHSLPCIPHGFWSRLISRLLSYMKDMLSGGETFTRSEYSSPFQLDPFCCRCPLVLENLTSGGHMDSEQNLHGARDSSIGGSFENLYDSSGEIQGVRFFGTQRRGTFINGRFFGVSDGEGQSSRSDSGYEYSSEEEDESHGRPRQVLNMTFPLTRSNDKRRRNRQIFKHGTDPGVWRDDESVSGPENATPKSDTGIPILRQNFRLEVESSPDKSASSLDEASCAAAAVEYGTPQIALEPSMPTNELEEIKQTEIDSCENLSFERKIVIKADKAIVQDKIINENPLMSSDRKEPSERNMTGLSPYCSSGEESAPYHSAVSRTSTPDTFPSDLTDGQSMDLSKSLAEDPKSESSLEGFSAKGISWLSYLVTETETKGTQISGSLEKLPPLHTSEGPECSEGDRVNADIEDGEAGVSDPPDSTICDNQESLPTPGTSLQFTEHPSEVFKDTALETPLTSTPSKAPRPCPERSSREDTNQGRPRLGTPHRPACPFIEDFPFEKLPQLPTDVAKLIDNGFLHCWKSGVCLSHPRLFLLLHCVPDTANDRQVIVTEVSPCPQGRRVLSYVVDHIDTLIREWYQELSTTDGFQPRVRQLIPCVVCERLGLEPYKFTFVQCQQQSSKSDTISCPKHPRLEVNLHKVAPDIMLHDVDADLLLSHDEITYEDTDSSRLGTGGFGKVVRGQCRGQDVAIKFYIQSDESEPLRHYREVRKELNVLRRVRQHPFLISVIGVSLRPLCLVLELAERGALTDIIVKQKSVDRIVLFRIAYQVADALRFLHDLGIIYRDLKPENVLVWSLDERDELHVKLIDFGTANFATMTGLISYAGTPGIRAPEMLECANKEEYTFQVDVYSYAILLYQLVTRLVPFEEYDSEPKINAAVIGGERPRWQQVRVTMFGLPTLTELMLRCWSGKPTRRPKSAEIVEQVRQPAFQCLLAKQPIPTESLSVRHACLVPDSHDLWLACDGRTANKIFIYNSRTLDMKFSFSIDTYQEEKYVLQIQCMHFMAHHMLIALRGELDLVNIYSTSSASRYKCVASFTFKEMVTCIASNDQYIFFGFMDGQVRYILKTDVKKNERRRVFRSFPVERHRILSMAVAEDKLWVATSRYIFRFFTKPGEMEAFDIDAMWYAGPVGMENNPQTQVSLLRVAFDGQSVLSVCRSVLSKWDVCSIQKHFSVDCASIIHSLPGRSTDTMVVESTDAFACITCVEPTRDAVWVGTSSGHILIFDSDTGHLLTWFHTFDETRSLTLMHGPGPCGTEQNYVISTGKGLRPEGLGTRSVCVLSAERVREPPVEIAARKISEPKQKIGKQNQRSPTPPIVDEPDAAEADRCLPPRCVMILWESVSKSCFSRIEAKSGRQRFPIVANNNVSEDQASKDSEEIPQT